MQAIQFQGPQPHSFYKYCMFNVSFGTQCVIFEGKENTPSYIREHNIIFPVTCQSYVYRIEKWVYIDNISFSMKTHEQALAVFDIIKKMVKSPNKMEQLLARIGDKIDLVLFTETEKQKYQTS